MKSATWLGWTPAMAISGFIMALVSPAVALDTKSERATLAGLTGVEVVVEDMDPDAEREGLAKTTLRTDVELKLRQAGIRILTVTERLAAPGMPYLYLRVATLRDEAVGGLYAINIALEVNQEVRLTRNPTTTAYAPTWGAGAVGLYSARKLPTARDVVRDFADQFINAYLAANPKR